MIAALVVTPLVFIALTGALLAGYFWFLRLSLESEIGTTRAGSDERASRTDNG